MTEVAVWISDYKGRRTAQLLETQVPIEDLLPPLIKKLELAKGLSYQLIPAITGGIPIGEKLTLAQAGITAGVDLLLKPEADELLDEFLEQLYDEIKDLVREQLWELAKQKLEELLNLNPAYPDPAGLRGTIQAKFVSLNAQPHPQSLQGAGGQAHPRPPNAGCCVAVAAVSIAAVTFIAVAILIAGWLILQPRNPNKQTKGSFTAELIPSGDSYYFTVTAKRAENIKVDVSGTDGYYNSWSGVGELQTDVIPRGAAGVVDTIQVTSLDSGEVQSFRFTFR